MGHGEIKYMDTVITTKLNNDNEWHESSTQQIYIQAPEPCLREFESEPFTPVEIRWVYDLWIEGKSFLPRRLKDPQYGKEELDSALETLSAGAPTIEDVWEITGRLPFDLSRLLSNDRDI
jgi:hypothetical protein